MVQVLEQETMPDAVEATLNYIVDTGEKVFTETAAPGSLDVRGGRQDPHRVTIRNGLGQSLSHGIKSVSQNSMQS